MVNVGDNAYSVPDATRSRAVEVHAHADEIRIFEDGALIAVHPVLEGRNQRRVEPGHRRAAERMRSRTGAAAPPGPPQRGDKVAQRPLAFYDAVGRALAREGRP